MKSELARRALPVARHECGHYVAARTLGFTAFPPRLTLYMGGHKGEAEIELQMSVSTPDEVATYAEGRAQVLAAGVLAESLEQGQINNAKAVNLFKDTAASQDYAKYREMVYLLRNIKYGLVSEEIMKEQLAELDSQIWNCAIKLVSENRKVINKLASGLAAKTTLIDTTVRLTSAEIEDEFKTSGQ